MGINLVLRQQLEKLLIAHQRDFIDLVRGSESIHEVQKGNPRVQCRHLTNNGHVMGFLNTETRDHREATSSNQHRVTVVSIDRKRLSRKGSRGDMYDRRQKLSGDLVEVGNVEQQAL